MLRLHQPLPQHRAPLDTEFAVDNSPVLFNVRGDIRNCSAISAREKPATSSRTRSHSRSISPCARKSRVSAASSSASPVDGSPPLRISMAAPVVSVAAVINCIDGDLERCVQIAFMLDSLDSTVPKNQE
jgi:hypothetical protein